MAQEELQEEPIILNMIFTLEEMNIILRALSNEPFKEVYQLIGKINEQASEQLVTDEETE